LAGLTGCSNLAGPNWLHPGRASEQQVRALRYDPYPQIDAGPSTSNVRPREYEKPIPEASQARWQRNNWPLYLPDRSQPGYKY
jgi:hypothetical protein